MNEKWSNIPNNYYQHCSSFTVIIAVSWRVGAIASLYLSQWFKINIFFCYRTIYLFKWWRGEVHAWTIVFLFHRKSVAPTIHWALPSLWWMNSVSAFPIMAWKVILCPKIFLFLHSSSYLEQPGLLYALISLFHTFCLYPNWSFPLANTANKYLMGFHLATHTSQETRTQSVRIKVWQLPFSYLFLRSMNYIVGREKVGTLEAPYDLCKWLKCCYVSAWTEGSDIAIVH